MIITLEDIQITVTYKKVKRVTLKVINGEVVIVCPREAHKEYLVSFIEKNLDWIKQTLAKKSDGPFFPDGCEDGDKITVLGDTYTVKLVLDGRKGVEIQGEFIVVHVGEKTLEKRTKILLDWLKITLERVIVDSLKKWNTLTGLDCSDITLKDMKSRWGSCNVVTKKIAFSLRLLSQKRECIDYVVLHELTHTIYRNHDKNFYGYIARFMPAFKSASKGLKMPVKNSKIKS
jgi:predicted metal-dependent hydrolase